MNDYDQALLDNLMYDGPLPVPELRVTAYWYASSRGLPCDLEFLRGLGLAAARRARQLCLEPVLVPEGPFWVHSWPAWIWDDTIRAAQSSTKIMEIYRDLPDAGWGEGQVPWDGDDIRY